MDKAYSRIVWQNQPSTATAVGATNLNKIDLALNEVDNRVVAMDTSKAESSVVNNTVQSITYNDATGVITITKVNGTSTTIDTKLEKLAVNFAYNPDTQQLDITLDDGTIQHVDLSTLITQYEFEDSDTIMWTLTDGVIKAEIINGSITGEKLQPNYLADIIVQANISTNQAALSKRYAVGGVEEGDATDNAKYYKEQAEAAATEAKEIAGFDPTTKMDRYVYDPNNRAEDVFALIDQLNTNFSEANDIIATAIIGKDPTVVIPETPTFAELGVAISEIESGTDTSDATITPSKVLEGEIGYGSDGKVIGTMPNKGAVEHTLPVNGSYTIPEGYHNGSGVVDQDIPIKTAQIYTPGTADIIIPSGSYLAGNQTILGEPNLIPSNIPSGITLFGIPGTKSAGGQIAHGQTIGSSTTLSFNTTTGGSWSAYHVTVSGLSFKPKIIVITYLDISAMTQTVVYNSLVIKMSRYNEAFNLIGSAYINDTGFRMPIPYDTNRTCNWWVFTY